MLAGALVGLALQFGLESRVWRGATWSDAPDSGAEIASVDAGSPIAKTSLEVGDTVVAAIVDRGQPSEQTIAIAGAADVEDVLASASNGDIVWFVLDDDAQERLTMELDPESTLARVVAPLDFCANVFIDLLSMLIVPIVVTSIISGVAGVGSLKDLRRLGGKTLLFYVSTSFLAILVGQVLVTIFRPGEGALLGLAGLENASISADSSFAAFLRRMVPSNVFAVLDDNRAMLAIIFFALMFGVFLTRTAEPHRTRIREVFESLFEVILRMAEGIMSLLPYGVFCLLARVVAKTGFGVFEPLLYYMLLVVVAILVHGCVTLPILVAVVGRISPWRWFRAMSPALMTAFSTSSSSLTLPVTLETVEKRGKVSGRIASFTLPLGSTVNMDGTALYECIGVIFLAQYYATTGDFDLTLGVQLQVIVMALLASIGAAGIPSAGLVMMLTILATLGLPLEGAALLLAVDRPLDMLRTTVNVWSDSCCAAVIARTEGEVGPATAGDV